MEIRAHAYIHIGRLCISRCGGGGGRFDRSQTKSIGNYTHTEHTAFTSFLLIHIFPPFNPNPPPPPPLLYPTSFSSVCTWFYIHLHTHRERHTRGQTVASSAFCFPALAAAGYAFLLYYRPPPTESSPFAVLFDSKKECRDVNGLCYKYIGQCAAAFERDFI